MLLHQQVRSTLQARCASFRRLSSQLKCGLLNLDVGGFEYTLFSEDVRKHPGCYFDTILSAEMGAQKTINVQHNGATFRFVNSFLVTNSLPKCPETGHISLDEPTLNAVASQAKSFLLPKLSEECEQGLKDLRSRSSVHSKDLLLMERKVPIATSDSLMVQSLHPLWRPLNLHGTLEKGQFEKTLFKESSVEKIDLNVLISTASIIRAPNEPIQEHVFELGSFMFDEMAQEEVAQKIQLAPLFPGRFVELRPRKLQILCAGASQHALTPISDPALGKDAVLGTVEVLLNSAYTGGELEVVCDDQSTDLKTAPYSWVAMRADATCSVRPVTSGARVSLLYDIIETSSACEAKNNTYAYQVNADWELKIFPHAMFGCANVDKLVALAKNLPINQSYSNYFQIDGRLCNEMALQTLAASMVERAQDRFKRDVVAQANTLEIHLPGALYSRTANDHLPSSGYLGSLVSILDNAYSGGSTYVYDGDEKQYHISRDYTGYKRNFIVSANTAHGMDAITKGARISIVYDLFDKHMLHQHTLEMDALSLVNNSTHGQNSSNYLADSTESTVPPTITRTRATSAMRDAICTSLSAAFAEHNAVIITLQNLHPTEASFDQTDFTMLQGGDRALYDTLTSSNDYDIELVTVTLHSRLDLATSKYVLSQASAAMKEDDSALLLVPTKLTDAHRVRGADNVYEASGLKVTKRV